jgi:hypothetical protein
MMMFLGFDELACANEPSENVARLARSKAMRIFLNPLMFTL